MACRGGIAAGSGSLCDDVFNAGADAAVCSVQVVWDDAPGVVAGRCGDGVDGAVPAVAEDDALAGERVGDGVVGHHDVVAVQQWLASTAVRLGEQVMISGGDVAPGNFWPGR